MSTKPHRKPLPPKELAIFQSLLPRMELSPQEKQHYENLKKGYEGELAFYSLLQQTGLKDQLILYDLLLQANQTEFQIDSLLMQRKKIFMFEIKNYEGDFYFQQDQWYVATTRKEIRNPLLQLKRSEFLLRQLLQNWGHDVSIESYIIFINPEFTLYHAPLNQPMIFPTQLKRFIEKLTTSTTAVTQKQIKMAEQFVKNHQDQSIFERLPQYKHEQLTKGILCSTCTSLLTPFTYKKLRCEKCGCEEDLEAAVMQSLEEFHLLFPDRKITTNAIHEWCGFILSKKTIRRILTKHLTLVKRAKASHFLYKQ
ncbi:nuclease-related domain-containing protein [Lederbergia ruris]|uniref:NERD domain-containing protein n=1 Tax=Lederbergia ruris TaxID=217495 RepID=A0ABQ4KJT4_9BACI|nr:nuclease-related domain-containing protein [Lederbergia ruris]GIN57719.1 hypothetical protein J8TS2_20380 [Lederbergia ruris]